MTTVVIGNSGSGNSNNEETTEEHEVNNNNEEKAEILWTRYEIAKEKALDAKSRAEYLTGF